MTSEQLTVFASVVLSVVFSYVPGANTWFAAKTTNVKSLIMLGLLALITGAVFGMAGDHQRDVIEKHAQPLITYAKEPRAEGA